MERDVGLIFAHIPSPMSLNAGPVGAPPPIRRRHARPDPARGNNKRRHARGESVLYRQLSNGTVMRATVLLYEDETKSYFIAMDLTGGQLDLPAEHLAPIPAL